MKLLNGDYLFQEPNLEPSIYFGILTAGFVILFIAGLLVYQRRGKLAPTNPILRRFIRRTSKAAMWIAGIGGFLALMRYTEFPFFSKPIFMYLLFLAAIAVVGYFVYDYSERYPLALWRLRESQAARRYRPTPRPQPVPQRARPAGKARGKQRR